jgi:hypothetical protein
MGMNINRTPQLEELVRRKVDSGLYNSARHNGLTQGGPTP